MPVASCVQVAVREVAANELQNDLQASVGGALARVEKDDLLSVELETPHIVHEDVRRRSIAKPTSGRSWCWTASRLQTGSYGVEPNVDDLDVFNEVRAYAEPEFL